MTARTWTRAVLVWALILACAILNGGLRESVLVPALGRSAGLVASGLLLSAIVAAVAFASIRWMGATRRSTAWGIGSLWLLATLAFEFGFGAGVQHKSAAELLQAYTFRDGNLWPLVLAVVFVAPATAWHLRGRSSARMGG